LAAGYTILIRCFIAFVKKKIADGNPIHSDWQNLADLTEFQEYRTVSANGYDSATPTASTPMTVTGPVGQTSDDIALFAEKQKYMYSVLERILQMDECKVIVPRSHDGDCNAQLIYASFFKS
jgi:hypothetical protein